MACPSQLSLPHDGNEAENVCLLQDLRVGSLVLSADVEKVSEASEMGLVKLNKHCNNMIPAGMTQLIFSLQFCAVGNPKSLILLANHEHTSAADFTDRTEISNILGRKITLLHNMSLLSVTYKFSHKNSPNEQNHLLCPKSPAHVLQI